MTGSTSSYCLNLNLVENSAHLVRGQRPGKIIRMSKCFILSHIILVYYFKLIVLDSHDEIMNEHENLVPLQSDGK